MTKMTEAEKTDAEVRDLYEQVQAAYHKEQAEKLIRDAAEHLRKFAKDVERYANDLHNDDLTAEEALSWSLNQITSILPNLRLDLFVNYAVNATTNR